MQKNKEYRRNNDNTHMAINNNGKIISHPTLSESQIFEIKQQIDILKEQLDMVANQRCDSTKSIEEQRSKEAPITMNISLMYEELSCIYESIGKPIEALDSLVMASQSLFDRHCYILNSVMGKGEAHEARLYALDDQCKELCGRHPELWERYQNSNMHYLLEEQHLWPCE